MKERHEIAEKYKWDLDEYFKNDDEYQKMLEEVENTIDDISKYEGKLNSSDVIYEAFLELRKYNLMLERLYVYANLRLRENNGNSKNSARVEKISNLITRFSTNISFYTTELNALSDEFLNSLLKEKRFEDFKVVIKDVIKSKPHVLSLKEERLLSGTGDFTGGFSDNFDKFNDADLKFPDVFDSNNQAYALNHSSYGKLMESKDRELRKNTFIKFHEIYGKFNNFLSSNYINNVKEDAFFAKIRNYPNALEAAIFNEDASKEVYKALIENVRKNIYVFEKYMEIKRKKLGLEEIAIYDVFAPIVKEESRTYTYEEAIELVKIACAPLGKEYVGLIDKLYKERWVDVFPNAGKDSGAFSWGAYGVHPVVLTNFEGTLNDVSTLAHEIGHALHSYFSGKELSPELASYAIYVAEVASTTNEMLLKRYLIDNAKTKEEKEKYYDELLRDVRSTIFRQTMFAEFEDFSHAEYEQTHSLSSDVLNDKYYELIKFYHGKKVKLVDEVKFEWSRIPHFYNSFYVYKYATGLISSIVLSDNIYNNKPGATEKYLNFLKSGCTLPPVELLRNAGVDLEKQETFEQVFDYINSILEDF